MTKGRIVGAETSQLVSEHDYKRLRAVVADILKSNDLDNMTQLIGGFTVVILNIMQMAQELGEEVGDPKMGHFVARNAIRNALINALDIDDELDSQSFEKEIALITKIRNTMTEHYNKDDRH